MPIRFDIQTLSGDEGIPYTGLTYASYKHLVKYEDANHQAFYSIGASIKKVPVALALVERVSNQEAHLRSIFVLPEYRNQGIGTALLKKAEQEAVIRGCVKFVVLFQRQEAKPNIMGQFLKTKLYTPPQFSALLCRSINRGKILTAPFLKKSLLPPSCELFLWKNLSDQERAFIEKKQRHSQWYPPLLSPFSNEDAIEYLNSLGLRYRGEIAGWIITHRISQKTIRYTTSFVREDLQKYGFTAPLLIEAIKIHMSSKESFTATDASFIIPAEFKGMIAFAKKRMLPFMEEVSKIYKCCKQLKK